MSETRTAIVRCPDCGQKNRLRPRTSGGYYSCARCGSMMKDPFNKWPDLSELLKPYVPKLKAAVRFVLGFRPRWFVLRKSIIRDIWQGVSASVPGRVALAMWGVGIWGIIVQPLFQGRLEIDLLAILVIVWFPAVLLLRFLKTPSWPPTNGAKKSHNGQYRGGMRKNPPRNLHDHSSK